MSGPITVVYSMNKNKAGASFGGPLLICLFKLTLCANSGSHTLQLECSSHILYCSRIRKNVTENKEQTDRLTDNRESNYRGHSIDQWIIGLSGPIPYNVQFSIVQYSIS